jgi:hypothetical protein
MKSFVLFIMLTEVFLLASSCARIDKVVRAEANQGQHYRVLFFGRARDTISEMLIIRENGFFEYEIARLKLSDGKLLAIKGSKHGYAGRYEIRNDTIYLSYYQNYKPGHMEQYLIYDSTKSLLYYRLSSDSANIRHLRILKPRRH